MKRIRLTMVQKTNLEGYIFLLPWLIGFSMFAVYPFLNSIRLSFSEVKEFVGFHMEWIGWKNYRKAFITDVNFVPMFLSTVRETLISTPIINIGALFFAILLNREIKFKGFFRGVFFLPVLLGTGYIMQEILGQSVSQQAIVEATGQSAPTTNQVVSGLTRGIQLPADIMMYIGPTWSVFVKGFLDRFTIVLWKSGVQLLLYLMGLQGISRSLYESAYCDGATWWEMFWKITLPMISPIILLSVVYTIIDSFTDAANPIVGYLNSIRLSDFGYAAAIGWIYFIFIFAVIALCFLISKRFVYNAGK